MTPKQVNWREDTTATVLARVTAIGGSGGSTGKAGEGAWLTQADISSIECKVFDLDSSDPDTATETETLTVADVILDTPETSTASWDQDTIGYNFIHNLSHTYFPTGDRRYEVEYVFTLADGSVFHMAFSGLTDSIRSS